MKVFFCKLISIVTALSYKQVMDKVYRVSHKKCINFERSAFFSDLNIFSNSLKEGKVWILGYRKKDIENSENPQKVSLNSALGNVNF